MNVQQVVWLMQSSRSKAEWDINCHEVKKKYPDYLEFWYRTIERPGITAKAEEGFRKVTIHVTPLPPSWEFAH